tara:strand:+ start:283 stop:507 length:225 start_codon:yes stop_codon:yes gene_type:complete
MARINWDEQRVEKLKTLWAEGKTATEIAMFFGDISRNSVIGKVHRLGLTSHRPPHLTTVTMPTYNFMKKPAISS